ncbi:MAG: hypothetical protein JXA90_13920 [Planctomycetes bacterium]|nr:hypothetical protein [Planctomycetota bacterium]
METKVVLCDLREDVVDAWKDQFDECPEVDIRQGDVFEAGTDALVLPGNGFGFLDRGLELAVCERFGWEVQDALRAAVHDLFAGELLVGQAHVADLPPSTSFRKLIYTCIWRTPQSIEGTVNAFLAARGALAALRSSAGASISSVVIPGMGTGSGGLHPLISARQVRYAYEMYSGRRKLGDKNLSQLARRERKLASLPRSARETEEG